MSKYSLIAMLIGMAAGLVLFFLSEAPEPPANDEPAQPLEGTLYSGRVEEMEKSGSPLSSLPQVTVPANDVKHLGLGEAKEILLKTVSDSLAKFRLLPRENGRKKHGAGDAVEKSTGTVSSSGAASPPASEYSFKFFNAILGRSESSYVLNNRFIKGGITFEATLICRWKDLYLLKFRVTNDEGHEFFIGRVDVQADEEPLRTTSYPPFSCQPFKSAEGIITFPANDAKGKKVSLTLVEGGEQGRTYPITSVDYAF